MTCHERPAPEPLKDYVRCIRVMVEPTQEKYAARILPCGCPELFIHASEADMDATAQQPKNKRDVCSTDR
ncbi:MAG: hypothetical protein IPK99_16055 [Flavobacteriales bacterium]|nr:hypothetical protein [Flavobacteriales bacterium]